MDAIASGSTEITASNLLSHFKHLTDFNGKGQEYMEDDFKVSHRIFPLILILYLFQHKFMILKLLT